MDLFVCAGTLRVSKRRLNKTTGFFITNFDPLKIRDSNVSELLKNIKKFYKLNTFLTNTF